MPCGEKKCVGSISEDKYSIFIDPSHETSFESITEINSYLVASELKPHKIKQITNDNEVIVNFGDGSISINGKQIDLDIDESLLSDILLKGLRWTNYNKKITEFDSEFSRLIEKKLYVVGWQGNDRAGNNVQRFVAMKPNGEWELWKKK